MATRLLIGLLVLGYYNLDAESDGDIRCIL